MNNHFFKSPAGAVVLTLLLVTISITAFGQDGRAGIEKATEQVKNYFDAGQKLLYAIGGIVGLVGAVKVYNKWSAGEPDTAKVASAWFGACIFLVVVATVLKAFFSI